MNTTTELRSAGKAPDWGKDYGISHLWTELKPGLWLGGTADDDTVANAREGNWQRGSIGDGSITAEHFDAVVTVYAWAQPVDWEVEELRYGFYDSHGEFDEPTIREAAAWAHRRWKAGKRVLIRCQAGLNRSSLIAALVLIADGAEPQEAIDTIRRRRSGKCLFNQAFVAWLHESGVAAS